MSKFHNLKIHFNFTFNCSYRCNQSMFQLQQAAGHSWCVPWSQVQHHCNALTGASALMLSLAPCISLIQSQAHSPWPVSNHPPRSCSCSGFHTFECTGLGLWGGVTQMVPVRTGCCCLTAAVSPSRKASLSLRAPSRSVLVCNISLHMAASVLKNTRLGAVQYVSLSWFNTTYCILIGLEPFPVGEW